jgi:hypothetical protein
VRRDKRGQMESINHLWFQAVVVRISFVDVLQPMVHLNIQSDTLQRTRIKEGF